MTVTFSPIPEPARSAYLAAAGQHCPFCQSRAIAGGSFEVDGGTAWQDVTCRACGRAWQDLYTLTDVEGVTDDGPEALPAAEVAGGGAAVTREEA